MASIASQYPADSDLIDIINDTTNQMSIWDPCPQSLSTITPIAEYRKEKSDQSNPMGVNKYFIESKQCGDWREYAGHPSIPGIGYNRETAINTMPRYRTSDSKFRFCIILAGPPGSGKTALKGAIKNDLSKRINNRVNNLPYVHLEIDDIIKKDAKFQENYRKIPIPPIPENKDIPINNDAWRDYITNTNKLYNNSRIGDSLTTKEMENFTLSNLNTIYNNLSQKYGNDKLKSLIITQDYDELKISLLEILSSLSVQLSNKLFLLIITCISFKLGLNITYETTFKNTNSTSFLFKASQLFTNDCRDFKYIFILGLPIVKYSELKSRIFQRFISNIKNNIPDIGLPDFNNCVIEKGLESCYINIASLVDNCTGGNKGNCYDIGIDFLLIYDNSKNIDKVAKFFDAVPISKRSLILAKQGQQAQATQLQIKSRRAFISVLMRNLNCLLSQANCMDSSNIPACSEEKCPICPTESCKTQNSEINYDLPQPDITPGLREFSLNDFPSGDDRQINNEERRKKQLDMFKDLYNKAKKGSGKKTRKIRRN